MLRQVFTKSLFIGALFVGVLAISACEMSRDLIEDLPTDANAAPPMVQIQRTLLVLPMVGASPSLGYELAKKMAWGLREAGYPARLANVANGTSPVLAGWIEEASAGGDVIWLNFDWAVYSPAGKLSGTHRQEMAVSRLGWESLSSETLAFIVTESVPKIHELVAKKIALSDRFTMVPTTLMTPSFTEGGFEAETVIVSSKGLSHVTAGGEEVAEQPGSILTPPTDENQEIAIEVVGEITLAVPEPQESPAVTMGAISMNDLPDGSISGAILPSVADIQQLPDDPVAAPSKEVASPVSPMGLDPALDEFEPSPGLSPDDIDILTPKSAALVTTAPELTLSEQIMPQPVLPPEPQPEILASPQMSQVAASESVMDPDQVVPGVDGLPEYAVPQPSALASNAQSGENLNRTRAIGQPVFLIRSAIGAPGDGNLTLPRALQEALRQADAAVTGDPSVASHIIQCSVLVETPFAGRQRTRIVWTVTDILGQETGSAIQENDVPQGSLDQSWVAVAPVIARAAVKGIQKLFINGIEQHGIGGGLLQPDLPHIQTP